MARTYTRNDVRQLAEQLGVAGEVDLDQLRIGMDVELEHGRRDPLTNVTDDDPMMTAKIALAHLRELPDYYTRLTRMEAAAERPPVVADLMSGDPITVRDRVPLITADRLMRKAGVSGLPVVNEQGSLVGVVSRTDLMAIAADPGRDPWQAMSVGKRDELTRRSLSAQTRPWPRRPPLWRSCGCIGWWWSIHTAISQSASCRQWISHEWSRRSASLAAGTTMLMNDDASHARTSQARIDELWDFNDPATSESRFREAAGNASTEREQAIMETQVARALGLQQRFDEAFALLDALRPAGEDPELDARSHWSEVERTTAVAIGTQRVALFEAAFELASGRGMENLAVDALHMMAIVAEPAEQLALNERAIAMAEQASDPRARQWLASLYNNTGWTRFDAGELDEALRLFELALEERSKRADPRTTNIARWAVARTLRANGRTAEALSQQRAIQSSNAEAGIDDPYVDEEIAECLLALGRPEEARPHFAKAAAGLEAELAAIEPQRIARLQELGRAGRASRVIHPLTDTTK